MDPEHEIERWRNYQNRTASGKPRPLVEEALKYVTQKDSALDLGAGALNDSAYLLETGFKELVAVDLTPPYKELSPGADQQFKYVQQRFDEFYFPPDHFDMVSAQFALPFTGREHFKTVWRRALSTLKGSGIFTGQLFGERDDWFGQDGIIFHSGEDVSRLINGLVVLKNKEREYVEKGVRAKHWHYYDLILKKT